eukprot:CAMPEP_0169063072 /NCGR_PEP_ID=MMETSP1015-20121227/1068_1 /TAXON_ID=342587 /ORGANISM="Karlodinium micrum, Strain CCMP2283" /LENGTH=90 /DNA_ID=CAMNT_0009121341 /DNA_START=929 /DNA_END=1201 /DNA_ORIENTATION=-
MLRIACAEFRASQIKSTALLCSSSNARADSVQDFRRGGGVVDKPGAVLGLCDGWLLHTALFGRPFDNVDASGLLRGGAAKPKSTSDMQKL